MASTLKVNTIAHSGGTTALTIDSSGRILSPARPAFSGIHINAGGNTGLTGTVIMNTEDFDIGGNYDNSTGIYTVPVTGIYRYSFSGFCSTSSGGLVGGQQTVSFQTNASGAFADYQGITSINPDAQYTPLCFSGLISATASHQLRVTTLSGTHIFASTSANKVYNPRLSIELVG